MRPVLLLCMASACAQQPKQATWATVVSIAPGSNPKWDSDQLAVTARSGDGLVGYKMVPRARLVCHVGDTVHATTQGLSLILDESACLR